MKKRWGEDSEFVLSAIMAAIALVVYLSMVGYALNSLR